MTSQQNQMFLKIAMGKGFITPQVATSLSEIYMDYMQKGGKLGLAEYLLSMTPTQTNAPMTAEQISTVRVVWEKIPEISPVSQAPGIAAETIDTMQGQSTYAQNFASRDVDNFHMEPGSSFAHYRIETELGRGGMGIVYKVYDSKLDRIVALKLLLKNEATAGIQLERFLREARSIAQLNHPNIIKVFDVGEKPRPYFTMEFIEGNDLGCLIEKGTLSLRQAVETVKKVSEALAVVHKQDMIHRDIKPANILIDPDGEPRLMDFGLAKTEDSALSRSGEILGTPAYMPPEQVNKQKTDAKSDIYSLGTTLYQALAGRMPFQGASVYNVIFQICNVDPTPPRVLNPEIPRDLEAICMKAMDKLPKKRYVSAYAFSRDLRNFLENRPVLAKPAGPLSRLSKWVWRNKALAFVSLILISTILVGGPAFIWYQRVKNMKLSESLQSEKKAKKLARQKEERARREEKQALWEKRRANEQKKIADKQREKALQNWELAEQNLYYAYIGFADRYRKEQNISLVVEFLDRCPQKLRDWEWHWLKEQCDRSACSIVGKYGNSPHCAYSPDGKKLAVSGDSGLDVWELDHMPPVEIFSKKKRRSQSEDYLEMPESEGCAFSPNGALLAYTGNYEEVVLLDASNGDIVKIFRGHDKRVLCCDFSPDGKLLASGGTDKSLRIWNVRKGKAKKIKFLRNVYSCDFSPDGKFLVAAAFESDIHEIRIFNSKSWREIKSLKQNGKAIRQCVFHPKNGKVVFCGDDHVIYEWDWKKSGLLKTLDSHFDSVFSCPLSDDGKLIVSASLDHSVKVWDVHRGRLLDTLLGHQDRVVGCAIRPDSGAIASAAPGGKVRLWDLPEIGKPQEYPLRACAFSHDGRKLIVGGDGGMTIWDVQSGKRINEFRYAIGIQSCAFSPGDKTVLTTGFRLAPGKYIPEIKLWDIETGEALRQFPGQKIRCNGCSISADGTLAATASHDKTVVIWEIASGKKLAVLKHEGEVDDCDFALGNRLVSTSGHDICLWNLKSKKLLTTLRGHRGIVECCDIYPGVQIPLLIASCSRDKTIRLWNVDTQKSISIPGHNDNVLSCAFSPDGKRLISTGKDGNLKIWDAGLIVNSLVEDKQDRIIPILTIKAHFDEVHDCAFSPDGSKIATVSSDKTIKLWNAPAFGN